VTGTTAGEALVPGDYEASNLQARLEHLELRVQKAEERRRALLHIMGDLHSTNRRLGDQRRAMIHIMGDLRETTAELARREQELREKQEQLIQAGKLATLGELTTGVAHELNNPLNNIGLFVGNVIDQIEFGNVDDGRVLESLRQAMDQVRKATEIISHLRMFGRAATVHKEPVAVNDVIRRALALVQEQLRLREIELRLDLEESEPCVEGNAIQLEQVVINLVTNARDAVGDVLERWIELTTQLDGDVVRLVVGDSGPGIPRSLEQRVFDPFFTTKEVGQGTGLGLSIAYGIVTDHHGTIAVESSPDAGAVFTIELPAAGSTKENG
jgi:C4-dicarboxylate-specific signal transduction histidine kinase